MTALLFQIWLLNGCPCLHAGSHYCLSFITEPKDQVAQLRNFVTLYCTVNITSLTSAGETQSIEWYRNQTGRPPPGSVINTTWGDVELESVLTFPTGSYYGDFQGLYHCAVTSQNSNVRIRSRDALIVGRYRNMVVAELSLANWCVHFLAQRITSLLRIYGRNESFVTVPSNETVVVVQRGYFLESSEPIWNVVCFSNSSLQFGLRGILHDFSQDRRLESQSLLFASLQDLQHVTSTTCTSFVIESMVATSNHSVYVEFSGKSCFVVQYDFFWITACCRFSSVWAETCWPLWYQCHCGKQCDSHLHWKLEHIIFVDKRWAYNRHWETCQTE